MARRVRPTITVERRRWLRQLRDEGPAKRKDRSRSGYDCMTLGWTEWSVLDLSNQERLTWGEAQARYPDGLHLSSVKVDYLEIITAEGLAALKDDEDGQRA